MKASKVVHADNPSKEKYRRLLLEVARLHERYVASTTEPFNVFSVLRSVSDEVNLHSRFLVALLDHRQPNEKKRSNLEAFLTSVAKVEGFEQRGVRVDREKYNIDILITNANKQAVIIENKIWASDQPEQLQRYHTELIERGFPRDQVFLRYLTPFGHDPSEDSRGKLEHKNIAYKDEAFQDWLRLCQQQAYDEPPLRESVGQYLRVVQKMTGTDMRQEQLQELVDLCMTDENLVLAYDLKRAFDESFVRLILRLLCEIEEDLKNTKLPKAERWPEVSAEKIRKLIQRKKGASWCGLYFPLYDRFGEGAQIGIELNSGSQPVFWGVRCHRERNNNQYKEIQGILGKGDGSDNWWPWKRYPADNDRINIVSPSRAHLRLLANDDERQRFAKSITNDVRELWRRISM